MRKEMEFRKVPRKIWALTDKYLGREWVFCVKLSMSDSSQVGSSLRSCLGYQLRNSETVVGNLIVIVAVFFLAHIC